MSLALILKRHGEMVNLASSHFVTRNFGERLLDGLLTSVFVSPAVVEELKRIIRESEITK